MLWNQMSSQGGEREICTILSGLQTKFWRWHLPGVPHFGKIAENVLQVYKHFWYVVDQKKYKEVYAKFDVFFLIRYVF